MKKLVRKVTASKKAATRKTIVSNKSNNKKAIMAGAGSGITLDIGSIIFNTVQDTMFKGETLTGKADGIVEIISIGTYYDGGKIEQDCPCEIEFSLTDDTRNLKDDLEQYGIHDILSTLEYDMEATIGGGWTRSTFDGTFSIDCWDYDTVGTFSITITDTDFVSYLDRVAHGENQYEEYTVYVDDEPFETYDSEQEATTRANDLCDFDIDDNGELLKDIYVERINYIDYYNGDSDIVDTETVWSSSYDYV